MAQTSSSKILSPALTALGAIAEVLVPGDDGYAGTAATLFAGGTPDLVVRPLDAAGVASALRYAADTGLAVTVRLGRPRGCRGGLPAGHLPAPGGGQAAL